MTAQEHSILLDIREAVEINPGASMFDELVDRCQELKRKEEMAERLAKHVQLFLSGKGYKENRTDEIKMIQAECEELILNSKAKT